MPKKGEHWTKEALAARKRPGPMPEETKRKISEVKTGKPGVKWTEERKRAQSDKLKGRKNPNITKALLGKPHPHRGGTKGYPCPWKGEKNLKTVQWWKEHPEKTKPMIEHRVLARRRNTFEKRCNDFLFEYFSDLQFNGGDPTGICNTCGTIVHFSDPFVDNRIHNRVFPCCPFCKPFSNGPSTGENELFDFISSIYDGPIERGNRNVLDNNLELDIYLPSMRLAFEFDGLIWHSAKFKDKWRNLKKTDECDAKGIKLVRIWDDDWNTKKEIIKSRIKYLLGKTTTRIPARKTICKLIDSEMSAEFLKNNHMLGGCIDSERFGLFVDGGNTMVAIMTFGLSKDNANDMEMLRYCSMRDVNVVGGAGKLLKEWKRIHKGESLITYASRDWPIGNLYGKLGFECVGKIPPECLYTNGRIRITEDEKRTYGKRSKLWEIYGAGDFRYKLRT